MRKGLKWTLGVTATLTSVFVIAVVVIGLRVWSGMQELPFVEKDRRGKARSIDLVFERGNRPLSHLQGRIILLDVWASWCGPCLALVPELSELQSTYPDRLRVIGLNVDLESWDDLAGFLDIMPELDYPVAMLPEGRGPTFGTLDLDAIGNVSALPTMFLLDAEGRLVRKYTGRPKPSTLKRDIQRLLRETPGS